MRIRISDLSTRGLKINEKFPAELLNERLRGSQTEIKACSPIQVVGEVNSITQDDAELNVTLTVDVIQDCASCLESKPHQLSNNLNLLLKPIPEEARAEDYEDDVGISYYKGEHVDISELALEALVLAVDLYWHPERDEDDICLTCHKDCKIKNESVSPTEVHNPFAALKNIKH